MSSSDESEHESLQVANLLCAIREEKVTKYLLLFENRSAEWFKAHELRPEVLKLGQWKFPDYEIEAIDDTWFAFLSCY